MFAVTCPYCRTVNKRGARFCADCGAPLHLKPCPKCGKVDDVTAKKCGSCGSAFPPIELAEFRADAEPPVAAQAPRNEVADQTQAVPPPALRPGPLIVIALVAGGLPLLWMNRAAFMPSADSLASPPGRLAVPVAPVPAAPHATLPPAQAVPAPPAVPSLSAPAVQSPAEEPPSPPTVERSPAPPAAPAAAVEMTPRAATPASAPKPSKPPAKPAPKSAEPEPPIARPAADAATPARECTESLAALGLCDRSQIRQ
jgi:hypothetical protein